MQDFDINRLVRPHILKMKPYSSARDEYEGNEGIFLDANETPWSPVLCEAVNRYPDPYQKKLKQAIAELKAVQASQIFLGNGSDEPIDLLFRAFCTPETDRVLLLPPTYGMYSVSAALNQAAVEEIPLLPGFLPDVTRLLAKPADRYKMVFICSPNNPSGNLMPREAVLRLLNHFQGLVVVDQAYIDFAPGQTLLPLLEGHPNLVVLQTFSKAWGMAGLRLGMAFASPQIVQLLSKIKAPYNLNTLTQQKALEALANVHKKDEAVQKLLQERQLLWQQLKQLPVVQHIYPSDANFLLVKVPDADRLYRQLTEKLVIVRNRSSVTLCENCLRISVGSPEENRQLLAALNQCTRAEL